MEMMKIKANLRNADSTSSVHSVGVSELLLRIVLVAVDSASARDFGFNTAEFSVPKSAAWAVL
jgi:hypothetical protein